MEHSLQWICWLLAGLLACDLTRVALLAASNREQRALMKKAEQALRDLSKSLEPPIFTPVTVVGPAVDRGYPDQSRGGPSAFDEHAPRAPGQGPFGSGGEL